MRRSIRSFLACVLLVCAALPVAGAESSAESGATNGTLNGAEYAGSYFKRVTLVVADMDRALSIYRDILGFDLDGISESSPDSYSYPVFAIPSEAKLRFATLSAGTEQIRTMALTEVKGIELEPPVPPYRTATVIRSRDIERDFERIEALELETTKAKFVDGAEFDFWERAFVDFDGHLIVLYEIVQNEAVPSQGEPNASN